MSPQFQQARWSEPLLSELGTPGERGYVPTAPEAEIAAHAPDPLAAIPPAFRR